MTRAPLYLLLLFSSFWSLSAAADAYCEGPIQQGNTWNLICAADGSGDTEYQCDYSFTLTNAEGLSDTTEATGSVSAGQSGVILWSGIQSNGADIVAAQGVSGACSQ